MFDPILKPLQVVSKGNQAAPALECYVCYAPDCYCYVCYGPEDLEEAQDRL